MKLMSILLKLIDRYWDKNVAETDKAGYRPKRNLYFPNWLEFSELKMDLII